MALTDVHRRIGLVGTAFSGKTVFLTSLLNHLQEHAPSEFKVGKDVRITNFRALDVEASWGARFPYTAYRDALVHEAQWPRKTRDTSHFICSFERSDWKISGSRLDFFDFPGERMADAAIAVHETFDKWSDEMHEYYRSNTSYRSIAAPYLHMLERESEERELLACYREVLGRFHLSFKPLVSPSTFLLDREGRQPEGRTETEFMAGVQSRPCEFAPLGSKHPVLRDVFAARYRRYREQVVMPVFAALQSSQRLIVMLDIPTILVGGVGMYNDDREILKSLVDALDPTSPIGRVLKRIIKILTKPLQFLFNWGGDIDRVAFVATKHDLVHPDDRASGRLKDLLRQMTAKATERLQAQGVQVEHFTCSAVVSARQAVEPLSLRGRLAHNNPERKEMTFKVSPLPERWPDTWAKEDFRFYPVYPVVPANTAIAPEQDGLDRIFEYITRD